MKRYIGLGLLVLVTQAGCAYHLDDPIDAHYQRYKARMPEGDRVFACHAYGCKIQTPFRFTDADIAALKTLMQKTRKADTAFEERRAVAYAIGWMAMPKAARRTIGPATIAAAAATPRRWTASTWRQICRATCSFSMGTSSCATTASAAST